MFDCISLTPMVLQKCCPSSLDTPQSELDIPSPVLSGNGDADGKRDGSVLHSENMLSSSNMYSGVKTVVAQQEDSKTLGSSWKDCRWPKILSDMSVNVLGDAEKRATIVPEDTRWRNNGATEYSCMTGVHVPARRASMDFAVVGGNCGVCIGSSCSSGIAGETRVPKKSMKEEKKERQKHMCSPEPENPVNRAAASSVLSGSRQQLHRRLTSPLPDDASSVPPDLLMGGQAQNEVNITRSLGTSLFFPSVVTGAFSHISCNDTKVNVSLNERPLESRLLSQTFPFSTSLGSLEVEQQERGLRRRTGLTCLGDASSAVGFESTGVMCQHPSLPLLAPIEENTPLPEKQPHDLNDTSTVLDTSAPKLVDWQVVIEESFSVDMSMEGLEGAEGETARHFDNSGKISCSSLDVWCEEECDISEPPPPLPAKKQERLPPLQLHSRLQKSVMQKQHSYSSESAVCAASWPPSIEPVDDCSEANEEETCCGSALQSVLLRRLLGNIAVTNGSNSAYDMREENTSPLPSPPPLSGGMDMANVPPQEVSKVRTLPVALVVEICRAVRPFARKLLLSLLKESNGSANVSIDSCTEALNCILEEERVCSVRATRCLCRSIVTSGGIFLTSDDMVSYVNFVARVMELAEET